MGISLDWDLFLSKYGHLSCWLLSGAWSQARWVNFTAWIILVRYFSCLSCLSLGGQWKRSMLRSLRVLCLCVLFSTGRIARCYILIFGRHFFLFLTDNYVILRIYGALRDQGCSCHILGKSVDHFGSVRCLIVAFKWHFFNWLNTFCFLWRL